MVTGKETVRALPEPLGGWPNDAGFNHSYTQHEPTELVVTGVIPSFAAGILYRAGPQAYKLDKGDGTEFTIDHWFDAAGQIHRFELVTDSDVESGVRVYYNSRGVTDEYVAHVKKFGTFPRGFSFAQRDPCQSLFKNVATEFSPTLPPVSLGPSSRNITVTLSVNMPGPAFEDAKNSPSWEPEAKVHTLHTKTDAAVFQQLDPRTLEPIGVANQTILHPLLRGPLSSAHAKVDPASGDMYNYNLEFGEPPTYRVFCVSAATGKTTILATISAPAAYIHSIFLTKNYVILCVWTSRFVDGGASVLFQRNIIDAIAPFDTSQRAEWFVIDRLHGKGVVAKYSSNAFFCFHTINAWEEDSASDPFSTDVVAEASVYDNLDILHRFYYRNLTSTSPGAVKYFGDLAERSAFSMTRFRLPKVSTSGFDAGVVDVDYSAPKSISPALPTFHPGYFTRPHRYTYGVVGSGKSSFWDTIVKFDSNTRQGKAWQRHGHTPGEPIFVPDPSGVCEDDGVLLSVVLDGFKERSYLLCLDAKSLEELGRAEVGGIVGFGFHGRHVRF